MSETNELCNVRQVANGGGRKNRPKGWSPTRRAQQAALIRGWQPWRRSTGPKTELGKARCAMNALKHGLRSRASIQEYRRIRHTIRLAALNNEIFRLLVRVRDAHPDLRPTYALLLSAAMHRLRQFRETTAAEKIRANTLLETGIFQRGQSPTRGPRDARMGIAALALQAMVAASLPQKKSRNRTSKLMKAEIAQLNQRAADGASRPRPFAW